MAKTTKPYKMTPERVAIILECLANGMTQSDCALLAGIHEDTLCSWKCNNSEFSEQMGQKAIEYKQKLIELENDFVLALSEEELDDELRQHKNDVLMAIKAIKTILRRSLNDTT